MTRRSNVLMNVLTGGMGVGKSTVAKHLREMGYSVIDTDALLIDLIRHNVTLRAALYAKFGVPATDENGDLNAVIAERYITDPDVYERMWGTVAPYLLEVIGNIPATMVEIPVIYPWLYNWIEHQVKLWQPPWSPGSTIHKLDVREFRIEMSDNDARIERVVSDYVKKEDLYLGNGCYTLDLLFHSREEIERNKTAIDAYRTTIKALDARQSKHAAVPDSQFGNFKLYTYKNDTPEAPAEIARQIAEELKSDES